MLQFNTHSFFGARSLVAAALLTCSLALHAQAPPGAIVAVDYGTDYATNVKAWSDATAWVGGVVPTSGDAVYIQNSVIVMDTDVEVASITVDPYGYLYLYDVNDIAGLTTDGSTQYSGTGNGHTLTITDYVKLTHLVGWKAGDNPTKGSTLVLNSTTAAGPSGNETIRGNKTFVAWDVEVPAGAIVDFNAGGADVASLTVTNSLAMKGGSVVNNPPTYGAASTLSYDAGASTVGPEWKHSASSGQGVPNDVSVAAGSTLNMGATANNYTLTGDLSVDGASSGLDVSAMDGNLTVNGDLTLGASGASTLTFTGTEGKGDLVVNGNATIYASGTVSGTQGDMKVGGNLTHNGTGGTFNFLEFGGSVTQSISGSIAGLIVDSLVVDNSFDDATPADGDVTFSLPVEITPGGVFNPIDGSVQISSTFTMKSNGDGTARIATLANSAAVSDVTGNITFERYVPSTASTSWLVMGNYVTTSPAMTVQDWAADFGGSIYVYSHDETTNAANCNACSNGWTYLGTSGSLSTDGEGYFTIVPASLGTSGHTLINTGTYATGNVARTVTHTAGSYSQFHDPAGWNLMVNPYASPIDGDAFLTANAAVSEYYVLDNGSGNWLTSGAVGATAAPDAIDIGQGFYAYVSLANNGATATFTPSLATYGANTFVREFDPAEHAVFALMIEDEEGRFGGTTIRLHEESTEAYEDNFDAPYKASAAANPKVYTTSSDGKTLAVNAAGALGTVESVPLVVETGLSGVISIGLDEATELSPGLCVRLVDLETNEVVALGAEPMELELEPGEIFLDRFVLEFESAPIFESTATHCQGGTIHFNGEGSEEWVVYWQDNENGIEGSGCVSDLPPGTYEVEGMNNSNVCYTAATLEIPEVCMGDFNFNGGRDIPDLLMLLIEMQPNAGSDGSTLSTDCDCDGVMTTSDLLLFLPHFGATCE